MKSEETKNMKINSTSIVWQSQGNEWENWSQPGRAGPRPVEGLVGAWTVGVGWRQVRFPCPVGPWEIVVADVTSGAWPPSLHLYYFPSSLVWCPPLCVLACLLPVYWEGEDSNPSLSSLRYKYKHNRPKTDFHWTRVTITLTASPIRRDSVSLSLRNWLILRKCPAVLLI